LGALYTFILDSMFSITQRDHLHEFQPIRESASR